MDTVLRPIDGTLKIKSPTFVRIEAGKGSAEYPRSARRKNGDLEHVPYDLYPSITKVASIARSRVEFVQSAYENMCKDIAAFNVFSQAACVNANEKAISVADIKNASFKNNKSDLVFNWDPLKTVDELTNDYQDKYNNLRNEKPKEDDDLYVWIEGNAIYHRDMEEWNQKLRKLQETYANNLNKRNKTLHDREKVENAARKLSDSIYSLYYFTKVYFNSKDVDCENLIFANSIKGALDSLSYNKEIPIKNDTRKETINDWAAQKKHYMRLAVCSFFSQSELSSKVSSKVNNKFMTLSEPTGVADNLADDITWQTCVGSMVSKPTTAEKIRLMIKEWADETYKDPYEDPIVNQHRWKVGVDGKILMSDNPAKTITFDNKGVVHATGNMAFTDKSCDDLKNILCSIGTTVE
jgi:hypothetical protein